jgi:gamma-glutamyltranspeptidase / glutathione hydrolase
MKRLIAVFICFISFQAFSMVKPSGVAVASASPYATNAALKILAHGGNAFDAAVAVSAVLGVVEPYHSGLGGGGFWLLHESKQKKNIFVDGRERAPMASHKDMYLDKLGRPIPGASLYGPLAAAIPGEPAALVYIANHFGKLPLKESLAPAIELAENGFIVDNIFHQIISGRKCYTLLERYPHSAEIFLPNGDVPEVGSILKQPALAHTLRMIAKEGLDGFYQGKIAEEMVHAVRAGGGIWTMQDLKDYQLKIRKPLVGHFESLKVITSPPPSAGGIALLTMLNILTPFKVDSLMPHQRTHYLIESMRLAYWDRAQYLGDPDYIRVPVKKLLSNKHTKMLRSYISPDKATPSSTLGRTPHAFADASPNTTHFSIIDTDGNMVSATLSINFLFGSSFIAGNTGVLLNDEMDDFSIKPGVKNIFGLVGTKSNEIHPGKRPLSSMNPTFLIGKDRVAVLGTPGGSRIPTMVLLATLAFSEGKSPMTMVSLPRFHHQYLPDKVVYEYDAFDPTLLKSLARMGHHLMPLYEDYQRRTNFYGDMQVVSWDKANNVLFAASDPRKMGLAAVSYKKAKQLKKKFSKGAYP